MTGAKRFPSSCVASPHYLATASGLRVLAAGGNAMDAAIATNLTLGVVAPYSCGFGGDLFAVVWSGGQAQGFNGSGRAPRAATVEAMRDAIGRHQDRIPDFGPFGITVPGAVEGWFRLLERFGSRPFAELAADALRYARDGFLPTRAGADAIRNARPAYHWSREWLSVYGAVEEGRLLRQPGLAATIETLDREGPEAFYRGRIGADIAAHLRSLGGLLDGEDLAEHRGAWVEPLSTLYRGVEVVELPPNTQGVAALEALNIAAGLPAGQSEAARHHFLIESMKLALADRDAFVTDPAHMAMPAELLASPGWAEQRRRAIDRTTAHDPVPGRTAGGDTAYLCAADAEGLYVSLIQSNWVGFGSGVVVPGWGINLHNRGAYLSLDPAHPNVVAPRKRTLHTLVPGMALRNGRPWLLFGSMGGDGQVQTHLQVLTRLIDDGADVQDAVSAPRWFVDPGDWTVFAEGRFPPSVLDGLRARGHRVSVTSDLDGLMGHANAIEIGPDGYAGATDPRTEGAVLGM